MVPGLVPGLFSSELKQMIDNRAVTHLEWKNYILHVLFYHANLPSFALTDEACLIMINIGMYLICISCMNQG